MHRFIASDSPYNISILTNDYSNNFTTRQLLTTWHVAMCVVKFSVIQIYGHVYGSINLKTVSIRVHIVQAMLPYKGIHLS